MQTSEEFYKNLENEFVSWAETVDDIRAAFIVGSRARTNHPADEWSDMDIVFYTSKQENYLLDSEWIHNLGNLWSAFVSQTVGGDWEWLTLFDGGWQVDFVIDTLENYKKMVKENITPLNFYRGVKVMIDKDQVATSILPESFKAPNISSLSMEAFTQSIDKFWFLALYTAKQILRDELWVAKVRDNDMKGLLLQMIEWHEKTMNQNDYDTWHTGRFLCEWTNKDTLLQVQDSFGHFDRRDSWRALLATTNLYQKLSKDIANKLDSQYPHDLERNVSGWINKHTNLI